MPVSSIYYLDTLAYLDFKFSVREAPFLKSVVTILPFTILHVVSSFWIHLKLFGSFQTKLNFLDHFRLNYFFVSLRQKINFFLKRSKKGPKKYFDLSGPHWNIWDMHWQAAMFGHFWEFMFFQLEKLIIFCICLKYNCTFVGVWQKAFLPVSPLLGWHVHHLPAATTYRYFPEI